ncbi:GNAT family N-acetyltransferase [Labrenzia sp. CE80]|uniref:GNAT family N-acetyltransferase n=1 Tax=Labrenzia sp. CE80 TaxID=1788986 RepID=UPI00129BC9D9|nr:GNAT family N-acetyltransferase [Labrenzia sp. CE80]
MLLRHAVPEDLPGLLDIHNNAVKTLKAIWTDKLDTLEDRTTWFEERTQAGYPVFVVENEAGDVIGFGSFGPYRPKEGYRLTVEHSIYILPQARGKGAGGLLLEKLIEVARGQGYHVMLAAVDGENAGSIALHLKFGFKSVGRIPQIGVKFGKWLDLVLMSLVLDDRVRPPQD